MRSMRDSDDLSEVTNDGTFQIVGYYVDGEPGSATAAQLQPFGTLEHNTICRKRGVKATTTDVESLAATPEDAAYNFSEGLGNTMYCQKDNVESYVARVRNTYKGHFYLWVAWWGQSEMATCSDPNVTVVATQIKSPSSNPPSAGHYDESIVVETGWLDPVVLPSGDSTVADEPLEAADDKTQLQAPVVASVAVPNGLGYYLVGADGGVFTFGGAQFWGSIPELQAGVKYTANAQSGMPEQGTTEKMGELQQPIVGVMCHDAKGYALVAADGGVFAFGDFKFEGSV